MEAICTPEMSASFCEPTWRNNPEDKSSSSTVRTVDLGNDELDTWLKYVMHTELFSLPKCPGKRVLERQRQKTALRSILWRWDMPLVMGGTGSRSCASVGFGISDDKILRSATSVSVVWILSFFVTFSKVK